MKYVMFFFMAIILFSCDISNSDDNKPEYFTVEYNFVNNDEYLDAVNLITGTYFPEKDITTIRTKIFRDVNPGDTVRISVDSIRVNSLLQIGADVIKGDKTFYNIFLARDTVQTRKNQKVFFNWPTDSLQSDNVNSIINGQKFKELMDNSK